MRIAQPRILEGRNPTKRSAKVKETAHQSFAIQDDQREAISKVVHVTMVEVPRTNAGQEHHKGSARRVLSPTNSAVGCKANGQVEVTNREIVKGMERRLGMAHQAWVDELPASKAEYQGKLGPTWEGPYRVRKSYGDGAYKLETLSDEAIDRTWNGTNL
ncbi:hypothetical protein Tco_1036963, partial [Tanacetum coccineum]